METRKRGFWRAAKLSLALSMLLVRLSSASPVTRIEFLGEARVPGGLLIEKTVLGGLSGITFDPIRNLYYVVADDPGNHGPARFYSAKIDLSAGVLETDGVEIVDVRVIQDPAGGPMAMMSIDPEGIAFAGNGDLFISSEGQVKREVAPFVRRYTLEGGYLGELPLPERYRPDPAGIRGPRHNLGFESLTLSPDKRHLFTAVENALLEDGPEAALAVSSPSRLLRFDAESGQLQAEFLYLTEPLAAPSPVPGGVEVTGLVDLLALDEHTLLAMERSYSMGTGNAVRIFHIELEEATDIQDLPALQDAEMRRIVPVRKELLLDLEELDRTLDNLEGMTLGPQLPDGRRTLILVADDNFYPLKQTSQFLAFALGEEPVDVERVQGAAHRSPLEGQWVFGVEGIITMVRPRNEPGFWMEDPVDDGDPATSQGVLVVGSEDSPKIEVGDQVRVSGRIHEMQRPGELGVTTLQASQIRTMTSDRPLPPPLRLNTDTPPVPRVVVDDDALRHFEPLFDGLDFWESIEGMRITLSEPIVIGPTHRHGEITVNAGRTGSPAGRTDAGGLLQRPGDLNPERLAVDFPGFRETPTANVGDAIAGELQGVVDYGNGRYRLRAQVPMPTIIPAGRQPERSRLEPGKNRLTVATFNVYNLSARNDESRFESVARTLVENLQSPDIVGLQEIQDDSGPADDGTVSAAQTLGRLVDAVVEIGGPRYEFRQIDPENNRDGGRPGSNIRVVFLFNPERVDFVDRGAAGPSDPVRWISDGEGVRLSASPGRLAPGAPSFNGMESRDFSPSRKPLIGEFRFGAQTLFIVNNHWSSKGGDMPVFGEVQPAVPRSEDQRSQQARQVADFVADLLRQEPQAGIIVLGDLNDHEYRSPLRILADTGLENMVYQLPPRDRYTFNYRGNSQTLDHILISRPLQERAAVRIDIVNCNADFADGNRASDHDPVMIELSFSSSD